MNCSFPMNPAGFIGGIHLVGFIREDSSGGIHLGNSSGGIHLGDSSGGIHLGGFIGNEHFIHKKKRRKISPHSQFSGFKVPRVIFTRDLKYRDSYLPWIRGQSRHFYPFHYFGVNGNLECEKFFRLPINPYEF